MEITVLIIAMAVVTYIPRALPAVLLEKVKIPENVNRFLKLIPFTALAALVFPGVLGVEAGNALVGLAGAAAAAVLSWFKAPALVVIAGSVASVALMLTIM